MSGIHVLPTAEACRLEYPLVRNILLLIAVVVVGAVSGALGGVAWVVVFTRSGVLGAATLTGTVALTVGLIGVFQEQIRLAVRGPRLRLEFDAESDSDIHITVDIRGTVGLNTPRQLRIVTAFVRCRVANRGGMAAKNVEMIARKLEREQNNGTYEIVPEFTPLNLPWSYTGETYILQIPAGVEKHGDIFFIRDPRFDSQTGFTLSPPPPAVGLMTFTHTPNVHPGILKEGITYRLTVLVAAENARSEEFTLSISWAPNAFANGVQNARTLLQITSERCSLRSHTSWRRGG